MNISDLLNFISAADYITRGFLILVNIAGLIWINKIYFVGKSPRIMVIFQIIIIMGVITSLAISIIGLIVIFVTFLRWYRTRKNRKVYTSAVAKIEGGGIKRGLTPPEASALLGFPFSQSILIALLQLVKKKVLSINVNLPVEVSIIDEYQFSSLDHSSEDRLSNRNLVAQQNNIVLYPYEHILIEIFEANKEGNLTKISFEIFHKLFIAHVGDRIKGYSIDETKRYYQAIVKRAPIEARTEGNITFTSQKIIDKNIFWITLHADYEDMMNNKFIDYSPTWLSSQKNYDQLSDGSFFNMVETIKKSILDGNFPTNVSINILDEQNSTQAKLSSDISRATFSG